jgi:RNA polymerase sigma-70 factor, ECF subfamily
MSPPENRDEDDAFLMEAVRRTVDGDVEAFAAIVQACQRDVAADLSRRLPPQDVQDVAQDAFVRAFRALPSFRGDAPLRIWVLRIARRAAMDFWRKRYRRRDRPFADLDESAMEHAERERQTRLAQERTDRNAQEDAREWLQAALLRLSPEDRAVVTLVELEDRTMEEAARKLGCGLSAVKVRAFRARRRLKTVLEEMQAKKREAT